MPGKCLKFNYKIKNDGKCKTKTYDLDLNMWQKYLYTYFKLALLDLFYEQWNSTYTIEHKNKIVIYFSIKKYDLKLLKLNLKF